MFSQAEHLIWLGSAKVDSLLSLNGKVSIVPLKTFVEKEGTFINANGLEQKFKRATTVVHEALTLTEAAILLSGKNLTMPAAQKSKPAFLENKRREDQVMLENRKKNEFVFKRGSL
jgi:NADH-quinone oxidoreductase subunit G